VPRITPPLENATQSEYEARQAGSPRFAADPTGRGHGLRLSSARGNRRTLCRSLASAGRPDRSPPRIVAGSARPGHFYSSSSACPVLVPLAFIFGVEHPVPAALIFFSAAAAPSAARRLASERNGSSPKPFLLLTLVSPAIHRCLSVPTSVSSSLRLGRGPSACMSWCRGPHSSIRSLTHPHGRIHSAAARLTYGQGSSSWRSRLSSASPGAPRRLLAGSIKRQGRPHFGGRTSSPAGVAILRPTLSFSHTAAEAAALAGDVGMLAHALRWSRSLCFGFGAALVEPLPRVSRESG